MRWNSYQKDLSSSSFHWLQQKTTEENKYNYYTLVWYLPFPLKRLFYHAPLLSSPRLLSAQSSYVAFLGWDC